MAVGKGTPGSPQHSPSNHSGPAHTHPPLRGLGAAERWAQPGPRAGLAKLNSHRPVLGAEELGKVSPHQTPKTSQAGSSLGSRVPIPRQEAGAPNPPSRAPPPPFPASIKWGRLGVAASLPVLRRAEVGGAPRSPPGPGPPSPPPRRSMLGPGPPPALHRRAARLQPARGHSEPPGPAPPSRRPRPDRPPSGPSGRCSAGEGSEGRPRPGRGHAQAPRVTRGRPGARGGRAAELRIHSPPPRRSVGSGLGGGGGSPSTPTRAPGPAAAGHCSSTKGQAPGRPPFPLRSSSRSLPRKTHSPALESRAGRRGSATPSPSPAVVPCSPGKVRDPGSGRACPPSPRPSG